MPRPENLWVTGGSAGGWREKAVEFAAGGVERALGLLGAVVNGGTAIFVDSAAQESVGRSFSQGRVVMQVPDDLTAQHPEIVYVPMDRLGRKAGCGQMLDERP